MSCTLFNTKLFNLPSVILSLTETKADIKNKCIFTL